MRNHTDYTAANVNSSDYRTTARPPVSLEQQLLQAERSIVALRYSGLDTAYYEERRDNIRAMIAARDEHPTTHTTADATDNDSTPATEGPSPLGGDEVGDDPDARSLSVAIAQALTGTTDPRCHCGAPAFASVDGVLECKTHYRIAEPVPPARCNWCGEAAHSARDCPALIKALFNPTEDTQTVAERLALIRRISIVPGDDNEMLGFLDGIFVAAYPTYHAAELALTNIAFCQLHGLIPLFDSADLHRIWRENPQRFVARLAPLSDVQLACQARAFVAWLEARTRVRSSAETTARFWKRMIAEQAGPRRARESWAV